MSGAYSGDKEEEEVVMLIKNKTKSSLSKIPLPAVGVLHN